MLTCLCEDADAPMPQHGLPQDCKGDADVPQPVDFLVNFT